MMLFRGSKTVLPSIFSLFAGFVFSLLEALIIARRKSRCGNPTIFVLVATGLLRCARNDVVFCRLRSGVFICCQKNFPKFIVSLIIIGAGLARL